MGLNMRPYWLACLLFLPAFGSAADWEADSPAIRFQKTDDRALAQARAPLFVSTSSTLYLYASTENPFFKEKKNIEQARKDVAAIYAGNKSAAWDGLVKTVRVIATAAEFEKAAKTLRFSDGIVELTDERFGMDPSLGTTMNYFYSKVYVGKNTKIGGTGTSSFNGQTVYFPDLYNYSYGVAHEFLHQMVNKAGYLLRSDILRYCPDYGHLNDGGLLTDAGEERLWAGPPYRWTLNRPRQGGTGIEKIDVAQLTQIGVAVFESEHASGSAKERLLEIMGHAGSKQYGF